MKRIVLTSIAAAAAFATVILGPDLLDLYQLDQHIKSSAEVYEGNGGPWPQVSDACVSCHGVNGNSLNQHYPSLAGQGAAYLAEQLRYFAGGQRTHPIMNAMARSLKEAEIGWLAEHFARQPAATNDAFTPDESLREQGRQVVMAGGCAACHGKGLAGQERFPRLAGQGYDYLVRQLDGYASRARRDPSDTMNQLASQWTEAQRHAIATFLASHP